MRNFYRLAQNIDVVPAMMAINRQTELWNQYSLRTQTEGTPHKEVEDIWLRMNDLEKCQQAAARDGFVDHRESICYPAWEKLPQVRQLIMAVMSTVEGQRLGRCFVSRMKPGAQIYPHKDIGEDLSVYYDNEPYYSRYHIVLQGLPGSLFHCEDETVNMRTGEVWWFNGALEHSVMNNSADDRIHIVADIKC